MVIPFLRNSYDGKLAISNTILISDWQQTMVQAENKIELRNYPKKIKENIFLRIKGELSNTHPIELKVISAEQKNQMFDSKKVMTKNFDITLSIKNSTPRIKINSNEKLSKDQGFYSLTPNELYLIEDNPNSYIYSNNLIKVKSHGYERIFKIKSNIPHVTPNKHGFYTVEIPMIYNKFIQITQGNKQLFSWCDFNHRINVKVFNLSDPIVVKFRLPVWIIVISLIGFFIWLGFLILNFFPHRNCRNSDDLRCTENF